MSEQPIPYTEADALHRNQSATATEFALRPRACAKCVRLETKMLLLEAQLKERDLRLQGILHILREMAGEFEKRLPRDEKRWADAREAMEAQREAFAEQTARDETEARHG